MYKLELHGIYAFWLISQYLPYLKLPWDIEYQWSQVHAFIETVSICHLSLSKSTHNASSTVEHTRTAQWLFPFNSFAPMHQTLRQTPQSDAPTLQHFDSLSRPWTQHKQHWSQDTMQEEGHPTLPQPGGAKLQCQNTAHAALSFKWVCKQVCRYNY